MKSKEYIISLGIDPDNNACMLFWLCDYTLEDWLKLPSEKRLEYEKLWNREPPKRSAAGWVEVSPRWDYVHVEERYPTDR